MDKVVCKVGHRERVAQQQYKMATQSKAQGGGDTTKRQIDIAKPRTAKMKAANRQVDL